MSRSSEYPMVQTLGCSARWAFVWNGRCRRVRGATSSHGGARERSEGAGALHSPEPAVTDLTDSTPQATAAADLRGGDAQTDSNPCRSGRRNEPFHDVSSAVTAVTAGYAIPRKTLFGLAIRGHFRRAAGAAVHSRVSSQRRTLVVGLRRRLFRIVRSSQKVWLVTCGLP